MTNSSRPWLKPIEALDCLIKTHYYGAHIACRKYEDREAIKALCFLNDLTYTQGISQNKMTCYIYIINISG